MRVLNRWIFLTIIILTPSVASAQTDTGSSVFWDVTKSVVFDPTTYAPATLSYTSMKMDWNSSQPLVPQWMGRAEPSFYAQRPGQRRADQLCRRQQENPAHGAAASAGVGHQ